MKTSKKLLACILVLSILAASLCAFADGGWSVNTTTKAMMNDKQARQALKKALLNYTGYKPTPLALLGTQVVSGMNYCLLCYGSTVTRTPSRSLCKVYVYEDLNGGSRITKISQIKLKGAPSSGWKISRNKDALTVGKKAKSALKKATADLVGAEYKPLLVLAKGQDSYCLLCRCKLSDRGGTIKLTRVTLKEKCKTYVISRIDDLHVAQ